MVYQDNEVPVKNGSLSTVKTKGGMVLAALNGELKAILCEYDVLQAVLEAVDGCCPFGGVVARFAPQYGEEAVRQFLQVLLNEELIAVKAPLQAVTGGPGIWLVGSGRLLEETRAVLQRTVAIQGEMPLAQFLREPPQTCAAAMAVPEQCSYGQLLELNRYCVRESIPFFLLYYNGKELTAGPFVFPWKGACFACQVTHRLRALNRNANRTVTLEELEPLCAAFALPDAVCAQQVAYVAELAAGDWNRMSRENASFRFLETERFFDTQQGEWAGKKQYRPITDCPCCHGMNRRFARVDGAVRPPLTKTVWQERPILYNSGGLRSVSAVETRRLIERALRRSGLEIAIERVAGHPFSQVLPVYDARLHTTHKNKTPYFFGEQVSHGKGMTEEQAYFSASFELIERLSARYYGETQLIRGSAKEVSPYGIDLAGLAGQVRNPHSGFDRYHDEAPVDWVWGESLLSGKPRLVPASLVFFTSAVFQGQFWGATSSGLSAGATLEDAVLQGLLELVEHDAWMIGQANPIPLPQIVAEPLENDALGAVLDRLRECGYHAVSRLYSNDMGIPVIRTWLVNPNNYGVYATGGFGASLCARQAYERSVTEAVQSAAPQSMQTLTRYAAPDHSGMLTARSSLYSLPYFHWKDFRGQAGAKQLSAFERPVLRTVKEATDEVVRRIRGAVPECDIVVVNVTREQFGVPVVRVLITGSVQRLGVPLLAVSPRLFQFAKNMGYSDQTPEYCDLYMGPYPH